MARKRKKITKKDIVIEAISTAVMIFIFALLNYTTFGQWDFIGAAKEYIVIGLVIAIIGLVVNLLFKLSYVVDPRSKEYLEKNNDEM